MMRLLITVLAVLCGVVPAVALESPAVHSKRATVSLVTDADAVPAGGTLHLALRLQLAPGWHTYWKNPGDAGVAPDLGLVLPPGVTAGPIAWPTPHPMPEGPVMTYGYTGDVLLPVAIKVGAIKVGTTPLDVTAKASWLVCEKVCVPEEGTFHLVVPQGPATPSAQAPLFAAAALHEPRPSPFQARVAPDGTLSLSGVGLTRETVAAATFMPDTSGLVDQSDAPIRVGDGEIQVPLKPAPGFKAGVALTGVVVLRDPHGQESALLVTAEPGGAVVPLDAPASMPLWQTLLLAVLAGLILNLMPCVFPVLAMKAVSLARLSGEARRAVRGHAAAYVAGVVLAFLALGGVLLALRAAGGAAGWGFQFQSPVFVAVMAWVLFAVGLNLSGVFHVGGRLAGAGQGLAGQGGHAGSFFTGLLAVVVATPCTAPFMGAAIAVALAAPAWAALLVFAAMGVGLAAPYALLALIPGLARLLPRPGAWMDVLRGALAFPMYAAAAWLVWVLSLEAGPSGVLAASAGLVLLAFAAWALGLAQRGARNARTLGYGVALLASLAALAVLPTIATSPASALASPGETASAEAFTPARLAALRAEGRPVFVNMTAAWCVTCLVNERLALSPEPVRRAFAANHVAYLKGDWTRGDPAITAYLRAHDRDGVPLYVFYPAGQGAPSVLPQILTESEMLRHLGAASGGGSRAAVIDRGRSPS